MKKLIVSMLVTSVLLIVSCGIDSDKNQTTNNAGEEENSLEQSDSYDYGAVPEEAEYVFIASHDGNLEDYKHKALVMLKNYVEANSNGRIGIQIYPNGQLAGSVSERMDGIIQESIDIVNTTGDVSLYWEPISIFDLPYMVTDDRLIENIFNDTEFVKELRDGALAATKNARLMIVTNSGRWRNFATTKKQIKSVSDLSGLKIRTVPSKVQQQLVTELGASPTGISWGEVYTSLSTGVVDGSKNGMVDIVNAKLHESLKYIILDGHAYMAGYWWVNNAKFKSMPQDLKNIFVDGFDAMSWFIREYNKYAEASSFEAFKSAGGTVYKPNERELQEFRQRAKGVEDWFAETASAETLQWLEKYKEEIRTQEQLLEQTRNIETQ